MAGDGIPGQVILLASSFLSRQMCFEPKLRLLFAIKKHEVQKSDIRCGQITSKIV